MARHISDYDRPKKASLVKQRYLIALMATLCPVVCYIGRQNLSLAITAMVRNPQDTQQPQTNTTTTSSTGPGDIGGACPRPTTLTDDGHTVELAEASYGPKYDWGPERSLVLGAFYWTYVFFQIPGARLAESLGAKWILATAVIGTCFLSILSPLAASLSVWGLFLARLLMGVCQAALYPACYALYSHWLPPTERSLMLPWLGAGAYIGSILTFSATGYFIEQERYGWEYAFYLPSVICAIWSAVWVYMATSEPRQHSAISLEEIEYIESRMEVKPIEEGQSKQRSHQEKKPISWKKLFTSQHIWAMMVAFFASNWSFTTVLLFLPTYLRDILHVSPTENGLINSVVYFLYIVTSPLVGAVSTMMIESRPCGMSRLTIRKLFQGVALFGQGLLFLALPWVGCDSLTVKGMFFAMIILYSFVNGGEVQIPSEMSVDFAGTIYAIGNCVGSSTGFILPAVNGIMVEAYRDDSPYLLRACWNSYFYLTAGVSITGGIIFCLFGRNDLQDFSYTDSSVSESQFDISKGSAFNLEEPPQNFKNNKWNVEPQSRPATKTSSH